jgi:hypothetical protein
VFAVFVTVGFFEVTDDTARPVKLGAEIGRLESRHVRHRFFAIIDRSDVRRLTFGITPNPPPVNNTQLAAGVQQKVTISSPYALTTQLLLNSPGGAAFPVAVGDEVVLDPGTALEETVPITAVTLLTQPPQPPYTWQIMFTPTRTHTMPNATTPIPAAFRGNPGPWANYNPRLDTSVVRYFSVIE